jgi:hypothetical protein
LQVAELGDGAEVFVLGIVSINTRGINLGTLIGVKMF